MFFSSFILLVFTHCIFTEWTVSTRDCRQAAKHLTPQLPKLWLAVQIKKKKNIKMWLCVYVAKVAVYVQNCYFLTYLLVTWQIDEKWGDIAIVS